MAITQSSNVVGLTGGIGAGKSVVADMVEALGWTVIDTDVVARECVRPGKPALQEIQRIFGPQVIRPDGELDRRRLAEIVFSDPAARSRLEAILHPMIRSQWKMQVAALGAAPIVVVIPLLFETNAQLELNRTVCVACSTATQRARLAGRDWSQSHIDQRLSAQWPTDEKMAKADVVIWTEGAIAVTREQVMRVFRLR